MRNNIQSFADLWESVVDTHDGIDNVLPVPIKTVRIGILHTVDHKIPQLFQVVLDIKIHAPGLQMNLYLAKQEYCAWMFCRCCKFNRDFHGNQIWRDQLKAEEWITNDDHLNRRRGTWKEFIESFQALSLSLTKLSVHPERDQILRHLASQGLNEPI